MEVVAKELGFKTYLAHYERIITCRCDYDQLFLLVKLFDFSTLHFLYMLDEIAKSNHWTIRDIHTTAITPPFCRQFVPFGIQNLEFDDRRGRHRAEDALGYRGPKSLIYRLQDFNGIDLRRYMKDVMQKLSQFEDLDSARFEDVLGNQHSQLVGKHRKVHGIKKSAVKATK